MIGLQDPKLPQQGQAGSERVQSWAFPMRQGRQEANSKEGGLPPCCRSENSLLCKAVTERKGKRVGEVGGTRLGLPRCVGARWLDPSVERRKICSGSLLWMETYSENSASQFGFCFVLSQQYIHLNIKAVHSTWQLVRKK